MQLNNHVNPVILKKIQYMGHEITDTKIIADVCNEHFVTIG